MNWMFNVITQRLNALFLQVVAANFETQAATLTAELKAELLQQAEQYRKQGLESVAEELEFKAESLSAQQPLASVLPSLQHWQSTENALADGEHPSKDQAKQIESKPPSREITTSPKKKTVRKKRSPK